MRCSFMVLELNIFLGDGDLTVGDVPVDSDGQRLVIGPRNAFMTYLTDLFRLGMSS